MLIEHQYMHYLKKSWNLYFVQVTVGLLNWLLMLGRVASLFLMLYGCFLNLNFLDNVVLIVNWCSFD